MKIINSNNPILLQKAAPVGKFDKKLLDVIKNMEKALLAASDPKGVGLAAPQVGVPLRIFLTKPNNKSKITAFINPEIEQVFGKENSSVSQSADEKKSGKKKKILEGCLSIPNIWGHVIRKKELTLSYQNSQGKKYKKIFRGFPAVVIQHEIDHLDGILFTKRVLEQKGKLYRSYKNDKNEDEFEEIKI